MVFTGSCDRSLFEQWIEECLVPELKPNQVVIMDNYVIHKSQKIKDLIERAKCKLIFLPPYSPDYSPIENFWANLKHVIRNTTHLYKNFNLVIDNAFKKLINL